MLDFSNGFLYDKPPQLGPTDEEMRLAEQARVHSKQANLDTYNVRIFDTSNADHVKEYEKLMIDLFKGVRDKKCVIWAKERTLINNTWKIYLEWSTYSITSEAKDEKEI